MSSIMPAGTSLPSLKFPAGLTGVPSAGTAPVSFADLLTTGIEKTSELQGTAELKTEALLTGAPITQVEVLNSVKQAELALKLMLQIRNKLLDAYKEVQNLRM